VAGGPKLAAKNTSGEVRCGEEPAIEAIGNLVGRNLANGLRRGIDRVITFFELVERVTAIDVPVGLGVAADSTQHRLGHAAGSLPASPPLLRQGNYRLAVPIENG
jgi:hypothetical protein